MSVDDHIAELARVVPAEFVAERTRRVKLLKEAGERDAAARLAALRKLSVADWALNVAATSTAVAAVAEFCDAAAIVDEAQRAAADGSTPAVDLRAATRTLRLAAAALADAAADVAASRGLTGAGTTAIEIGFRLTTIAPDRTARAALQAGAVGMPTVAVASDAATAGEHDEAPLPDAGTRRRRTRRPAGSAAAEPPTPPTPPAVVERSREERLADERARRDLQTAARRQQRELRQAERAVEAATTAMQVAAERLAAAQAHLAATETTRDEARRRADELTAAIAAADARRTGSG